MSGVRLSIVTWSVYVVAVGLGLLLVPESVTDLVGMDTPTEVWIRVAGVATLSVGVFYFAAAVHRARWLFWYSVPVRIGSGVALAALAVTESVWRLWLLGIIDILGAGWTFAALRWKPAAEPLEPSAVD